MPHPTNPIVARAMQDADALHEALALRVQAIIRDMRLSPDTPLTDAHRRRIMREIEPDMRQVYGTSPDDKESGVHLLAVRAARLGTLMPLQDTAAEYRQAFGDEVFAAAQAEAMRDGQ